MIDSAYLQALDKREYALLFALIPKKHQEKLEALFGVVEEVEAPALDPDGKSGEDGGHDLFLDVDGDSDDDDPEAPGSAPLKNKKKKKKKKKKKVEQRDKQMTAAVTATKADAKDVATLDVSVIRSSSRAEKAPTDSKTDAKTVVATGVSVAAMVSSPRGKKVPTDPRHVDMIRILDNWVAKGAMYMTKQQARNTSLLLDAAKVGHVGAVVALLEKPEIRVLQEETCDQANPYLLYPLTLTRTLHH